MSLLQELKRRNVIKVGFAYIVVAWLVAQVLQLVFESFGTPDWVMKTVLVLMAVGLLFVLFFAWAFELTPEGLKREKEVDRSQSITPQTGKKLNNLIIFVMALAIAYFAYDKFMLGASREAEHAAAVRQVTEQNAGQTSAEPHKSVAVLPFVDMSAEQDQDYFTDGLTENLLNALAQLQDLKVAGRTSSFAFKGRNEDLRSIGNALGVANLLEGSVQKSGEQVRITAQLVSANNGYHLWSQTYDRTLNDIFAVQDEIANEVARAMKVTLLGQQTAVEPVAASRESGAAYNDYLKGLYELHRGDLESNDRAIEYFQRALKADPNMALAWAGLASALDYKTGFEDTDFTAGYEKARTCALRALEINPNLPEGYMALAGIQSSHDWDWEAAEASLNRALALRPGDTSIRLELALLKAVRGKVDEAFAEYQRVVEQDPLDLDALRSLANALTARERYEEALEVFEQMEAIDPDRPILRWSWGSLHLRRGEYQQAVDQFSREPYRFLGVAGEAIAYHHMQQQEQAAAKLQTLISTMGESAAFQIAAVYAQWGDADNAMSWLERGYIIRDPGLKFVGVTFLFDPIREDPRFQAFLEKMNF
ncbi:MAG: tetratricopeptide repeat protein [Xanthomonadales bacterium]|nr:tetratricopeptide repeat protein [Xanthomonadales bacterium]